MASDARDPNRDLGLAAQGDVNIGISDADLTLANSSGCFSGLEQPFRRAAVGDAISRPQGC